MNNSLNAQADQSGCRTKSWLASIAAGVLVFLLAWKWLIWGFFPALFIGLVVFFVLGYLLINLVCDQAGQGQDSNITAAASAASAVRSEPAASPAPKPAPKPAPAPAAPKPAAAPPPVAAKPAAKAAPKPAAKVAKPAAAKPAAKKPAAKKPAAKKPAAAVAASLSGPRGGKADDLKQIKGVGPSIEKTLNGMGIYHFDQVAAWKAADIAKVEDKLPRFKGRAERDGWMAQAQKLAAGEDTEFSARVKKGDVY